MAETLTLQQVYDDLTQQLQHGAIAVLSPRNLPSERLWTLVAQDTEHAARHARHADRRRAADAARSVRLSPIAGDAFTVAGQVTLLNLTVSTIVTVTVREGEPDLAFALAPPRAWTLGQSLWPFDNRLFDIWCSQLTNTRLRWQSAGKTPATALVLDASLLYSGVYHIINVLYAGRPPSRSPHRSRSAPTARPSSRGST